MPWRWGGGVGHSYIYALWVRHGVKGMDFKQFSLG